MLTNLQTALLDLLNELHDTEIKLIIGGGYGLYLRTEHVRISGKRTLLKQLPEVRSTNDLVLFLRPELLIDSHKLKPLSKALIKLSYSPVPGAENYQFIKAQNYSGIENSLKIDILTGPASSFEGTLVKVDDRRARPKPSVNIHAHPTNEAITLEEGLQKYTLKGMLTSEELCEDEVFLPNSYTFLMMKLFAFKDRINDSNKEYGRYHALDLYTIIGTTTESEWEYALQLSARFGNHPYAVDAGRLVSKYFSDTGRLGIIRLKESPYYHSALQMDEFISAMSELFPYI